jgi:voltage-gated potassium channel
MAEQWETWATSRPSGWIEMRLHDSVQDQMRSKEPLRSFRGWLRGMYHGRTKRAVRFQIAVLGVDLAVIAFFIVSPVIRETKSFIWLDYAVAAILVLDMSGRALASRTGLVGLMQPTVWVDVFILLTLLFPQSLGNLGFLRILRLWSLSRSGFLWRSLKGLGLDRWREASHSVVNLVTFLFVVTGFVYTFFFSSDAGVTGYIDALYFTVATVTTTGFGDIVLPGVWGKLTAIATMIVGITLFVRLAQALFRPAKVVFQCPRCALQRHEPDAVYCKACGEILAIPDEGD